MKFRKLKKIGKRLYGKKHFYMKIVSDENEIPTNIIDAKIPGYCIQDIKHTDKMIIYKNY